MFLAALGETISSGDLLLHEFAVLKHEYRDAVENRVELDGFFEDRDKFAASLVHASPTMDVFAVDEAATVHVIHKLITESLDHLFFLN